ncbi:MAG: ATP-dependent DNA helicase [Halobacteriales archaeon]|nr:ATP-dependent DNA helicase [Halobacteriales archaeon]
MDVRDLPLSDESLEPFLDEGIESLYPPQAEAVEAGVAEGESVVAAVPTASGKTLIAELAMLSAVENGGKALYVVPLRALASEKSEEFRRLPVDVGVSTGDYDERDENLGDNDIIVATSEKVDSLVRNGVPWVRDVSCVVLDEVHLIDDSDRGPTLEVTTAKLRRLSNPQFVALSATVANADEFAGWLDAELVESDWRPVDLKKGVAVDGHVEFDDGTTAEGDDAETLVSGTVKESGQAIVFVNSRRSAEATAERLSELGFGASGVEHAVRDSASTDTGERLADCLEGGVAFHHAGLKNEHRAAVEDAFRSRDIVAVCATPTLAAGVNMPARRVVVRDHMRYSDTGMKPLPVLEVHQMFGRAGRPGLDPHGEAVLVAGSADPDELREKYVEGEPEPVYSKLASRKTLRTHLLSTVASGFASSREGVLDFLNATFYAHQEPNADLSDIVDDVLGYLRDAGMLTLSEEDDEDTLEATDLGHTVSRLYVDPLSAERIAEKIQVTENPTTLTFLEAVSHTPDMYRLYLRKGDDERMLAFAQEHEDELVNPPSEFDRGFEDWLASLKTAVVLHDWTQERDEDRIAEKHDVAPGDVRTRVERADWLLYAAESLAQLVDSPHQRAVHETRLRVQHGVRDELLDLVSVSGVGRVRARRLYEAGIEDRDDLREANVDRVARLLGPKTAENILSEVGRDTSADDMDATASPEQTEQSSIGDF